MLPDPYSLSVLSPLYIPCPKQNQWFTILLDWNPIVQNDFISHIYGVIYSSCCHMQTIEGQICTMGLLLHNHYCNRIHWNFNSLLTLLHHDHVILYIETVTLCWHCYVVIAVILYMETLTLRWHCLGQTFQSGWFTWQILCYNTVLYNNMILDTDRIITF